MAKVIWRYTLSKEEQKLWESDGMRGWRAAMEGFVEDEARDQGCRKYAIYKRDETLIVKNEVEELLNTADPNNS